MENKHRYIARFVLEAETPLFVGSGQASLLKDALVQKDVNGLPTIPGTSLAGVLRHAFAKESWCSTLFGDSNGEKDGTGSLLKVSSAYMLLNNTVVSEGIMTDVDSKVLNYYNNLPSRQHVRITDKGVAKKNGLFDNEVVYKGTRFVFELELRGSKDDMAAWELLIKQVQSPIFRLGSGTRNGYGKLKVIYMFNKVYDLTKKDDFEEYLNFNPSLNAKVEFVEVKSDNNISKNDFIHYSLLLQPDSFFIFSEGFGDDEADNKPLEEEIATYNVNTIKFEKQTVIPASSIKGAIAHRVAFHYNKLTEQFADEGNGNTGTSNEAIFQLFGAEGGSKEVKEAQAGNVFINDFYYSEGEVAKNKIFNHVAIDRFTGGAMEGALFSEKVNNLLRGDFSFDVYVKKTDKINSNVETALDNALKDIAKGLLPLGGMTTKGHGMFTGVLIKDEEEIFNYSTKTEK